MDLPTLAETMLAECERDGQSARSVDDDGDAQALRALLRLDTRDGPMRIRTARMDDIVVVVRTDADLWNEDTATMRRKLRPSL